LASETLALYYSAGMIQNPTESAGSQNNDFLEFLHLADARLKPRFKQIIQAIRQSSAKSFPLIFVTKSALAGFYRFVNNKRVHYFEIIEAATAQTFKVLGVRRTEDKKQKILAVHDTSIFSFDHNAVNIEGLGRTTSGKVGFFGHFCVAINPKSRENMGLLGLTTWIRPKKKIGYRTQEQRRKDPRTESHRWPNLIHEVQNKFDLIESPDQLVHVADREADDYASYCDFVQNGIQFVFRVQHNRSIEDEEYEKLFDSIQEAQLVCEREVSLSARKKSRKYGHKTRRIPRAKRVAKLGVSAKRIQICKSKEAGNKVPKTLELNFVRVFEIDPIDPKSAVEWVLATTLSIDSVENILEIVDIYCARWSIEEYFKALKAGCSFEKRNLESLHSLLNCLAIFSIHACNLYNLKIIGRANPESNSESLMNPTQIKILALSTHQEENQLQTAGTVMKAIAQMGGHLQHNRLPGWQVLARGYEKLILIEEGWKLAELSRSREDRSLHV
jgi:hypothetical protein